MKKKICKSFTAFSLSAIMAFSSCTGILAQGNKDLNDNSIISLDESETNILKNGTMQASAQASENPADNIKANPATLPSVKADKEVEKQIEENNEAAEEDSQLVPYADKFVSLVLDKEGNIIKDNNGNLTGVTAVGTTYSVTFNYGFDKNTTGYNEDLISEELLTKANNGEIKLCQIHSVDSSEAEMNIPEELSVKLNGEDTKLVVISVQAGAFEESNALGITLPETVTQIGENAFLNCRKLKSANLNFNIPSYDRASKYIRVKIGDKAFQGCALLEDVNIKTTLEDASNKASSVEFSDYTFKNCAELKNVNIDTEAVMRIGKSTFENCSALVDFEMPDNLDTMGVDTFKNCNSLETFRINSTFTGDNLVAVDQFNNCQELREFLPAKNGLNDIYEVKDGCLYKKLGGKEGTLQKLAMYPPNKEGDSYTVPETVTIIIDYAFGYCYNETTQEYGGANRNLVNLTISNPGEVLIGTRSLYKAAKLESVKFAGANTYIGESCFEGCENLKTYTYTNTLQNAVKGDTAISQNAFRNCTALTNMKVVNWFNVGKNAFQGCTSLVGLEIGNIVNVGDYCFADCDSLRDVTINDGISNVGNYVFKNCISIEKIDLSNLGVYQIVDVDGTFGVYVFENCKNLQEVIMPATLVGLSTGTFKDCINLQKVKRPEGNWFGGTIIYDPETGKRDVKQYPGGDFIGEICNEAFYNCSNLTEIFIPRFLVSIGDNAFYNCTSLKELNFTRSVLEEYVESTAFQACSPSLKINAPEGSGMYDFAQNNQMQVGTIDDDMIDDEFVIYENDENTSLYGMATGYRGGFKSLVIRVPSTGTYRIDGSYKNNSNVAWINCAENQRTSMRDYLQKLTLRNISVGSEADDGNYQFNNAKALTDVIFEEPTDTTVENSIIVCEGAFSNCTSLKNVVFCSNITDLGKYTFENCTALERIALPKKCINIGELCFTNCNELKKVKFNSSLQTIGKRAFNNCVSLGTVTIPGNTYVGENSFIGCTEVKRVIAPSNVNMVTSRDSFVDGSTGENPLTIVTNDVSKIVSYASSKGFNVEYASFLNGINEVDIVIKGQVIDTEGKIASITKNGKPFTNIKKEEPVAKKDSYDNMEFTSYDYTVGEDEDYVVEGDELKINIDSSAGFVPFVTINDDSVVDVVDGVATYVVGENEHVNIKAAYGDYHYIKIPSNIVVKRGNEYLKNNAIINAGESITITAEPENGYEVKKLTLNGIDITDKISNGYVYNIQEGENIILEAVFDKISYHVTIPKNVYVYKNNVPVANGAIINGGDELYIVAIPPDVSYEINELAINGKAIDNETTYKVKANENVIITVRFIQPNQTGGYPYGDINADNAVTEADAELLLKKVRNDGLMVEIQKLLGDNYINVADVDGDGSVTATDAAEILLKANNPNYIFNVENK